MRTITDCFKRMSLLPLPSHVAQWHSILLGDFSAGLAGWVGCRSSQTSVSSLFSLLSFLLSHHFCTDEEDQNCTFKSWAKHASKQCHHALSFVTCSPPENYWHLICLSKDSWFMQRRLASYTLDTDEWESASDFTDSCRTPSYILII